MLKIVDIKQEQVSILLDLIYEMAEYEKLAHEVKATTESLYDALFNHNFVKCKLLYEDEALIGYVLYIYDFSTFTGTVNMYLEDIYIREAYRKKGYGKEIFYYLGKVAKDNNMKRIDFVCLDWNEKSLGFYKRMGASLEKQWLLHRLDEKAINDLGEEYERIKG